MRKGLFLGTLLTLLSSLMIAQKLEKVKLFSTFVNDSIPVKIWLPEDYKPTEKYPVIYEFIYDHSNYIAATLQNMWSVPKSIVVYAHITGGNDHYSSPKLTETGQKYYLFVKNELIDYITKQYHTTYRTAAGLSQGADYITYILRNDPQLFNSYMVFSIERPISYTANLKTYTAKLTNNTSCFIGIANDMVERTTFANQLYDSLKTSQYIKIKKENYPNSEHSYSILYGLTDALSFIYKEYYEYREPKSGESLSSYYQHIVTEKRAKFGQIHYNSFISHIGDLLKKDSPISDVNDLIDLVFNDVHTSDIDLFNLGYPLSNVGLYGCAEKAYKQCLLKSATETNQYKMDELSVYYQISRIFDKQGKTEKAIEMLKVGYEKTKKNNEGLLYQIGYYYIDKKLNVKEGINVLKSAITQPGKISSEWEESKDNVYAKIAKGYWILKNNTMAKEYNGKSLEINPKNTDAIELKELMKQN